MFAVMQKLGKLYCKYIIVDCKVEIRFLGYRTYKHGEMSAHILFTMHCIKNKKHIIWV